MKIGKSRVSPGFFDLSRLKISRGLLPSYTKSNSLWVRPNKKFLVGIIFHVGFVLGNGFLGTIGAE